MPCANNDCFDCTELSLQKLGINFSNGVMPVTVIDCKSGDGTDPLDNLLDVAPLCYSDTSGTTFYGFWSRIGTTLSVSFYTVNAAGATVPYTPVSNPEPCPQDIEIVQNCYIALAAGDGYAIDDRLTQVQFWDTASNPRTLVSTVWYNETTRTILIAPPVFSTLTPCDTSTTIATEVGCLGDPAGFDAENVERCYLPEVIIDGTTYNVNLPVGWTVNELVAAVNAIEPGKLSNTGSVILSSVATEISVLRELVESNSKKVDKMYKSIKA